MVQLNITIQTLCFQLVLCFSIDKVELRTVTHYFEDSCGNCLFLWYFTNVYRQIFLSIGKRAKINPTPLKGRYIKSGGIFDEKQEN